MDLDGDGRLSPYELHYFYEEQMKRLESLGMEPLTFDDTLKQMLDIVMPTNFPFITLTDLKRSKMSSTFFDTFFNVDKYLEFEQKESFAPLKKSMSEYNESQLLSKWDEYVANEYENLVLEDATQTDECDDIK